MKASNYSDIPELAKAIYFNSQKWSLFDLRGMMLKFSMRDTKLKNQLFRFVDLLPNLKEPALVRKYLFEYLGGASDNYTLFNKLIPDFLNPVIGGAIKSGVGFMASSYIAGSTLEEVKRECLKLETKRQLYTLDILGEHVVSDIEAQIYRDQISRLIDAMHGANISIKLSSICAAIKPYAPSSLEKLKNTLRPILRLARSKGAFINVDIESYDWRDLSYAVIRELLIEDEFKDWTDFGTVLQAYLRDSGAELDTWLAWVKKRGAPITIRLVKGAYWDYEQALSEQRRWKLPVYSVKAETDYNFENLSRKLLNNSRYLRAAIASHNIRSLAAAIYHASSIGLNPQDFELQVLYGMVDNLKDYLSREGYRVRVYLPFGELIPGMSYLVRRLLENTANESFLRLGLEGNALDASMTDPAELLAYKPVKAVGDACILPAREAENYVNKANLDLSDQRVQQQLSDALAKSKIEYRGDKIIPLIIAEREIIKDKSIESLNPCDKSVIARVSMADLSDAKDCIEKAQKAQEYWREVPVRQRAEVLRRCAEALEENRYEFNALLVREIAKTWAEADAEVSEAIDFLDYYASHAEELYDEQRIVSLHGERNTLSYKPYGVATVIAPWNFPLAILTGMTAAALVTGNTVIVKPSEQSSVVAYEIVKLIKTIIDRKGASYPGLSGTINLLTGSGELVGNYLVEHPNVRLISFTGSEAVGRSIAAKAASASVRKQVIAEMGGKNAIIVDETADLDEVIPGVLHSAFGYAGQKCSACSRLIVTEGIYDRLKARLLEALKGLVVGDASDFNSDLSAVIDAESYERINKIVSKGASNTAVIVPDGGYYISPVIFETDDLDSSLVTEEIFGPVLVLIKVKDLKQAVSVSNNSRYGLTGGIYSRSPVNINYARKNLEVGNLYINRACTGAIVSRQAFGGLKNSSIGFKAGGPNYLLQFVQEQCVSENTMRKGFEA